MPDFSAGDTVRITSRFGTLNGETQSDYDRQHYVGRKARVVRVFSSGPHPVEVRLGIYGGTLLVSPKEIEKIND